MKEDERKYIASSSIIKKVLMLHKERKNQIGIGTELTLPTSVIEETPIENESSLKSYYFLNGKAGKIKDYKKFNHEVFMLGKNYRKIAHINDSDYKDLPQNVILKKPNKPLNTTTRSKIVISESRENLQAVQIRLPPIYKQLRAGVVYPKDQFTKNRIRRKVNSIDQFEKVYNSFLRYLKVNAYINRIEK